MTFLVELVLVLFGDILPSLLTTKSRFLRICATIFLSLWIAVGVFMFFIGDYVMAAFMVGFGLFWFLLPLAARARRDRNKD